MDGSGLRLRARRGPPDPDSRDGRLVLRGEVEWLLDGPPDAVAAAEAALGGVCERLGDALMVLDFGNAVGLFDVPGLGRVEVVSGKWDDRHFTWMLADLVRVASGLPFAAGTAGALPYDRSVAARQDVLYHAFVYLRSILAADAPPERRLRPALALVLREPHRRFDRVRREVPLETARRVDPSGLVRIAAGLGRPVAVPTEVAARAPLARALRGRLPTRVEEAQVRVTYYTPENRFVKTFLGQVGGLIEGMRRVVGRRPAPSAFERRILADCEWMEQAIGPIRRHPFWDGIGPMAQLPVGSTVLQRRRGYRDVFGHFSRLRLAARVPLDREQVRDLLEMKDIAELYELWCYFSLTRAVERLLGPPSSADRPVTGDLAVAVPRMFEVAWPNGTRLLYNPTFSRSGPFLRRSYSVPLRPDVALEVPSGPNAGLHLLDAKFKLDRLDALMATDGAEDETADEVAAERRGTFKRGDLYKIHAYRDAISRARSVWILYPGTEMRFFSSSTGVTAVPHALPNALDGVGAIPMTPEDGGPLALETILARLLALG